jgi:hypothetical protein
VLILGLNPPEPDPYLTRPDESSKGSL